MTVDVRQLAGWLPEQRWFGSKDRIIESMALLDQGVLDDGPPALVLAIVEIGFTTGPRELYHLPLLLAEDGTVKDVSEDPAPLRLLGELLSHGVTIKGEHGVYNFTGPGLDPLSPPGDQSIRLLSSEQSNSSVVLDEKVIVKLFRRLDVGPNPDLELMRFLTDQRFEHVPAHLGEVSYEGELDGKEVSIDLGIAQQLVVDARDGWAETVKAVHALYEAIHPEDVPEDFRVLIEERAAEILDAVALLGEVTAAFHIALTREDAYYEVLPEPIDQFDLQAWAREIQAALELELVTEQSLLPHTDTLRSVVAELRSLTDGGMKTRVHGDYHLGQVLMSSRGWMILDLEGEPARPLEERRAKRSPLRDVAGMLRSLSYAASAALFDRAERGSEEWARLEPWADAWEDLARDRFLGSYLRKSHEGRFLPADRDSLATLLHAFEIDKALYELRYERGHRPHWLHIPLRGIEKVALRHGS